MNPATNEAPNANTIERHDNNEQSALDLACQARLPDRMK
jgi:hypothetical protein